MVHFGEFLKTWSLRSNSVTRQVSFNRTKIGGKCQKSKIQMRHFEYFSNNVNNIAYQRHCCWSSPEIMAEWLWVTVAFYTRVAELRSGERRRNFSSSFIWFLSFKAKQKRLWKCTHSNRSSQRPFFWRKIKS